MVVEDPATRQKMKLYRGMTSPEAVADGSEDGEQVAEALRTPAEGQSVRVPYVGSVVGILARVRGHLQSAVSYAGETTLAAAHRKISRDPGRYPDPALRRLAARVVRALSCWPGSLRSEPALDVRCEPFEP